MQTITSLEKVSGNPLRALRFCVAHFAVIIFFLYSYSASAQKSKLREARNYYKEPYQQYDKAKEAIDLAAIDEETGKMAETWYYRGLVYSMLFNSEKHGNLCDNCLEVSYSSFMKANEIDPKNEWAGEITGRVAIIMHHIFGKGVEQFNAKDYAGALRSFETVQKISPTDTSIILNSAYAADRAGNLDKARLYYERLVNMKYKDPNIYLALSTIYKQQKDAERSLMIVKDGRKIFPDSLNLMLTEINLLLAADRSTEAIGTIEQAIKKDTKNENLYLALGSAYDNLANPKDARGQDLPKPVNSLEYMSKAEQAYRQGLEVNPKNYEINYNMGAIYFNRGAEMANRASSIKSPAEYEKAQAEFILKFKEAQPYLEKALEITPYDKNTLLSLKELYARINDIPNHERIMKLLEAVK